ncbi:MAG: hypothetical protein HUJ25_12705 [Crocinitomicaceae bacterium]|nr:hypothetical protein [Crocinitomicaceae bacterium]
MNQSILILLLTFLGCSYNSSDTFEVNNDVPDKIGRCPEGHTDHVIPIVYGMPDEDMFTRADSGLIYLAGCELSDETYWCKQHEIAF